jgi:hypothetical protein
MRDRHLIWKTFFLLILAIGLLLPATQQFFGIFQEKPLQGAFASQEKPDFSALNWHNWRNGSFQDGLNEQIEANIGFRNSLVRLNNQWQYLLFRKANAEGVIVGKEAELFEEDYIRAATGSFFVGADVWKDKALKMKASSDLLHELGKELLIIFEPGKGSLYHDRYPAKYKQKNNPNNYEVFKKELERLNVPLIDLNACFIQWRDTASYALFPRTGTHWSYYGAALAADTTLKYLSKIFPDRIPQLVVEQFEIKDAPRHPDDDIWLAMNLLKEVPYENLAYPVLSFTPANQSKIKTLIIGDSFYFNWQNDGIMKEAFDGGGFWYYNKQHWDHEGAQLGQVEPEMLQAAIHEHDLFIIMITERFHHNFAWGFDEQLYDLFFPGNRNHLAYFSNQLRIANEEFMRLVEEAETQQMPLEERIRKEAEYLMYMDYKAHPERYTSKEDLIMMIMMSIRGTPEWFAKVEAKAVERNISVDDMVRMDAEWIYNSKHQN